MTLTEIYIILIAALIGLSLMAIRVNHPTIKTPYDNQRCTDWCNDFKPLNGRCQNCGG